MDPITTTITVAKAVGATLQVLQTCNEYYQKYQNVNLQLVCMQTQCSIIEVALLQIQDVIVNNASRFDQLQSVSVLASNYERNLGACQTVFAVLNQRLDKLHGGLRDHAGKPDWQAKLKFVWNEQESAMLLRNIEGQASAIGLLLNAIQMKKQDDLVGLLTRRESKTILKTASDDAVTLLSAHEDIERVKRPDEVSVVSTGIDDTEFDFDFEVINTAAYRKAFNAARRKLNMDDSDKSSEPPLPTLLDMPQTEPVFPFDRSSSTVALQDLIAAPRPCADPPELQSSEQASQHIQLELETQYKGSQSRLKSPPRIQLSQSARKDIQFGDYMLGKTLGKGQKSKFKLAWSKDGREQVAIKLVRRQLATENPVFLPKIYREVSILRVLQHHFVIHLHEMIETERHIGIVLDYISGGQLEEYINMHRYLKDSAARMLLAQVISGAGYLHQKGVLHLSLSCKNILLNQYGNATITGFSHANTFDPDDELGVEIVHNLSNRSYVRNFQLDRMDEKGHMRADLMVDRLEQPYFSAPEAAQHHVYEGRKADIWSIGVIMYFMLAGQVPWADSSADSEAVDTQQRISYIVNTPIKFPEYVKPHARDLVRRILQPNPLKRADLTEIAHHSWLFHERHILAHDFSY